VALSRHSCRAIIGAATKAEDKEHVMKDLKGKVAFVTGGSSGIGYGLAEALGKAGMHIMIAGINEKNLDAALGRLRAAQVTAERVQCDVANRADVQKAALATIAKFGKVHLIINNAGVSSGGPIGTCTERDWRWVFDVNVMGVVNGTEIFAPLLAQHGEGGHIVNVASIAGMIPIPAGEPYAASKFAVVAMSEGWRVQLAPRGIGVSVLCPAFVRTNIVDSHRNRPAEMPAPAANPAQTAIMRKIVSEGMDPAMLAARVIEAIRDDELYIFTHPEMKGAVEARFQSILAAFDQAGRSPALKDHTPQDLSALMPAPSKA
jgi:NAD(P)-dependent dehydrogenase (short-subunit alcohol dehydrogenase family)